MGWGYGIVNGREVGYTVPDICHHPECSEPVNRGLGCLCGNMPGDDETCEGFFCGEHLYIGPKGAPRQMCLACLKQWEHDHEGMVDEDELYSTS